ncbi:MAG: hypothetical protein ACYC3X_27420 [Pirellulaceae bacterium]
MNKAFVREPDNVATYCPRCGSQGEQVGTEVLTCYLECLKQREGNPQ